MSTWKPSDGERRAANLIIRVEDVLKANNEHLSRVVLNHITHMLAGEFEECVEEWAHKNKVVEPAAPREIIHVDQISEPVRSGSENGSLLPPERTEDVEEWEASAPVEAPKKKKKAKRRGKKRPAPEATA